MSEPTLHVASPNPVVPGIADIEAMMRQAFAATVNSYHERDQIIVRLEQGYVRLVYINVRTSRQSNGTTMIQCQFIREEEELRVSSLQVSESLCRQGLDRDLVAGVEHLAKLLEVGSVKVYPLSRTQEFWGSLGYVSVPEANVLEKRMSELPHA